MPVDALDRAAFADPGHVLDYIERRAAGQLVVMLDVGGYFAAGLHQVCDQFSGHILGVVEDTENGHQRYLAAGEGGKLPYPVYSVARSPLKEPEDYLVGQSVTFSAEALIRARGDILHGRPAAVIGYGKLGRSIAATLHAKHIRVTVYDSDPVRRAQALAQGFRTAPVVGKAVAGAGLVVCATGNRALTEDDFGQITNGAYVASVTSRDDELDLDALDGLYERIPSGSHITRYSRTGHYFYVLADGNAVNFLHGACVGAFIFLVQAEILAALANSPPAGTSRGCTNSPPATVATSRHVAPLLRRDMPMTITRDEITTTIANYLDRYPGESGNLEQVRHAMQVGADITSRSEFNGGQTTCGAVVLDETRKLLLIRHKALAAWLLPGGHVDPDDAGLMHAALRELEEETGIAWQETVAPYGHDTVPVDIDIHAIPANPAKSEPAHWHADFRYAFYVNQPGVNPNSRRSTATPGDHD